MKVSVIGTGYVGLVSGTCFAEMGHTVTCIDVDKAKITMLKEGKSPIYEPGLTDLLLRNIKAHRLFFSEKFESVTSAQVIFLAVGTPCMQDGSANLDYLLQASHAVAENLSEGAVVVIKSTVPVGTSETIRKFIAEHTKKKFFLVSNPEFLKEGSAVLDFMKPDRVIIGSSDDMAITVMKELYSPLMRQGNPVFTMSNLSAELTKYACNAFLATKISFINMMANMCDVVGADVEEVREGMISDPRIGKLFLYPGPGYGGSCFPKDVQALIATGKKVGMALPIIEATEEINELQKNYVYKQVKQHYGSLKDKVFAIWGVSFKPNTDDIREAPALNLVAKLMEEGAKVKFHDPVAEENFLKVHAHHENKIKAFADMYECLEGADSLILLTEWPEFRSPDFSLVKKNLKESVLFDGRNIYSTSKMQELGFTYYGIGKRVKK